LLPGPRFARDIFGLACVFGYVCTTGAGPSAVRAFVMVACFWVALRIGRQSAAFSAWVNSALLVLLWDPRQLWMPGFQLSYGVVGGILLLAVPWTGLATQATEAKPWVPRTWLGPWYWRGVRWWKNTIATVMVSAAATLCSAPIIVESFGVLTPGAVLLNVVLVPAAGLVVATGCASWALGLPGWDGGAGFVNRSAWVLLAVMDWATHVATAVPGYLQDRTWRWPGYGPVVTFASLFLAGTVHEPVRLRLWAPGWLWLPPGLLLGALLVGSSAQP
jgi:competence protein ComEC